MRALLDVNVLIALLDSAHVHHDVAMKWLGAHLASGWASCPLTENGCVRIMSQPTYPNAVSAAVVADRLREATRTEYHAFWPDDVSVLEEALIDWQALFNARHLTDAYLLALAVHKGGAFVTFDHAVPVGAVSGATDAHLIRI